MTRSGGEEDEDERRRRGGEAVSDGVGGCSGATWQRQGGTGDVVVVGDGVRALEAGSSAVQVEGGGGDVSGVRGEELTHQSSGRATEVVGAGQGGCV